MIRLDISKALQDAALEATNLQQQVAAAQAQLEEATCPGNDFLG